jgi:hypothetical protein
LLAPQKYEKNGRHVHVARFKPSRDITTSD